MLRAEVARRLDLRKSANFFRESGTKTRIPSSIKSLKACIEDRTKFTAIGILVTHSFTAEIHAEDGVGE